MIYVKNLKGDYRLINEIICEAETLSKENEKLKKLISELASLNDDDINIQSAHSEALFDEIKELNK